MRKRCILRAQKRGIYTPSRYMGTCIPSSCCPTSLCRRTRLACWAWRRYSASPLKPTASQGASCAGEDEAAGIEPKVDAAGGDGDPHHVVRHGRGDPPAMVPGHRALLGILVVWLLSLRREWAHTNGSGPNPSRNDPHVTHVGDFLLHPRGRFQGRRPTQPWGRWCRGLQITARRGCRGVLLRLSHLRFLRLNKQQSGTFSAFTTFGGVWNLSGTKGKKSSSPACQLHDGSMFHPSAKHCHAFAGPRATCWTCGSRGSSLVQFAEIFLGDHPAVI